MASIAKAAFVKAKSLGEHAQNKSRMEIVIWVIAWIVLPYLGVLAYLIFQGRGMAERNVQQAQQARDELRRVVGFSAADEIEKLDRLKAF
jgi:hypothetical protein